MDVGLVTEEPGFWFVDFWLRLVEFVASLGLKKLIGEITPGSLIGYLGFGLKALVKHEECGMVCYK